MKTPRLGGRRLGEVQQESLTQLPGPRCLALACSSAPELAPSECSQCLDAGVLRLRVSCRELTS